MNEASKSCYVCFHGHFYQPPRENPWLEAVERETSAAPHHDWNQRICEECYRANSASRVVDDHNRVLRVHNNYEWINFDFGPTLLRWLAMHDPWLYDRIRGAEETSRERFRGHGNAMAQVYNHIIMPLADSRDKRTEILWGIRDFERRFGHAPEGMWLAETAVDKESLRLMAEAGIRYTILAPHQALRWRLDGGDEPWHEVDREPIPTGRAYRCNCGEGRWINLFFYDGGLSHGIAFGELLSHSSKLIEAVHAAAHPAREQEEPCLVLAATDGESFGHHFKFGDMALAAALEVLNEDSDGNFRPINLGAFLEICPPKAEVEIRENTSWSCVHGVERWRSDCGCRLRTDRDWHQRWRRPLRDAMNLLRDRLGEHFERRMNELCLDPWAVRDDYIEVVIGEPGESKTEFLLRHAKRDLSADQQVRFFQLLEMERCALLMFTSCGWFFDDIGGLESQMILRYAARAVELANRTEAPAVEGEFVRILETAPSNERRYQNGAYLYERIIKPQAVSASRVVASHIVESMAAQSVPESRRYYCFSIGSRDHRDATGDSGSFATGRCRIEDLRTGEKEPFWYVGIHLGGGLDYRAFVGWDEEPARFQETLQGLRRHFADHDLSGFLSAGVGLSGALSYSRKGLLSDVQDRLRSLHRRRWIESSRDCLVRYWQGHHLALRSLVELDPSAIDELRPVIEAALNAKWVQSVNRAVLEVLNARDDLRGRPADMVDPAWERQKAILADLRRIAADWRLSLDRLQVKEVLCDAFLFRLKEVQNRGAIRPIEDLIGIAEACEIGLDDWLLQTLWFDIAQQDFLREEIGTEPVSVTARRLDLLLGCRFCERWESVTS